ncbi:MAG: Crp/Fnr family transcriptional regulator [Flavobacteriales bacterium]
MTNKLFEELAKIGVEKKAKSHQIIVHFGEKTDALFLIKSGGFILKHVHPKTMKERAINFFTPNFHALASVSQAYIFNETSKYFLKTFTNTVYIEIKKNKVEQFLRDSSFSQDLQSYGLRTMVDKNELRANLLSLDSTEMLEHLNKQYPQILLEVPSKYIADFLGITPQWLSKLKHKL